MALIVTDLLLDAMEKVRLIRETSLMVQGDQKSYSYVRRKDLEFDIDDWIHLKV